MAWLTRLLAPLSLRAVLFTVVYGLHGLGCARGWPGVVTPFGSLHVVAMVALWLTGLAGHVVLLRSVLDSSPGADRLIHLSGWVGLAASLLTLWPFFC